MEIDKFVAIDSFPLCSEGKNILSHYMLKSVRITVVSFCLHFIKLYADHKVLKIFTLMGEVSCGTIITVPKTSSNVKNDQKVLIVGCRNGHVFALKLPSSDRCLRNLENSSDDTKRKRDFVIVHKYENFKISRISCIKQRLLLLGKADCGIRQLVLFHTSILTNLCELFDFDLNNQDAEVPVSTPYEIMDITIPSAMLDRAQDDPHLVIFQAEQGRKHPYFHSMDNILHINENLYVSLFGIEAQSTETPIACFFFPQGDVWFFKLKPISHGEQMQLLCTMHEECASMATVLLNHSFLRKFLLTNDKKDCFDDYVHGLVLLGKENNAFFLTSNTIRQLPNYAQTAVPYSVTIRTHAEEWSGIFSCAEVYLSQINQRDNDYGVEIIRCINSRSDQCIDKNDPEELWTFKNSNMHTSLLAVATLKLASETVNLSVDNFKQDNMLSTLRLLNKKHIEVEKQSGERKSMLHAMEVLTNYLLNSPWIESEKPLVRRNRDMLEFDIAHETVNCGKEEKVHFRIEVTSNLCYLVLKDFQFKIRVVVQNRKTSKRNHSNSYDFSLKETNTNKKQILCILVDCDSSHGNLDLIQMSFFIILTCFKMNVAKSSTCNTECNFPLFPLIFEVYRRLFHIDL